MNQAIAKVFTQSPVCLSLRVREHHRIERRGPGNELAYIETLTRNRPREVKTYTHGVGQYHDRHLREPPAKFAERQQNLVKRIGFRPRLLQQNMWTDARAQRRFVIAGTRDVEPDLNAQSVHVSLQVRGQIFFLEGQRRVLDPVEMKHRIARLGWELAQHARQSAGL